MEVTSNTASLCVNETRYLQTLLYPADWIGPNAKLSTMLYNLSFIKVAIRIGPLFRGKNNTVAPVVLSILGFWESRRGKSFAATINSYVDKAIGPFS